MIRVLVVGEGDPEPHLHRLALWNGGVERMPGRDLKGIDLVLALPGGNGETEAERARRSGVRVAEVVDVLSSERASPEV